MQPQALLNRCKLALFIGLCAVLCAPLSIRLLHLPVKDEPAMQELAAWPEWSKLSLPRYLTGLEQWINHHYPLRQRVIRWNSTIKHQWLKSPSPLIVVGSDNWLFYMGNGTMEDLLGRDRFTEAELRQWVSALEGRRAWLRQRGVKHVLVIAPNKSTVYWEKLPLLLQLQRRPGKFDQLVSRLEQTGIDGDLIDLRPVLAAEKLKHECYWPTDSHWNAEGLLASCDAILSRLKSLGVTEEHRDYRKLYRVDQLRRGGDCVGILAMVNAWPDFNYTQVHVLPAPDCRMSKTSLVEAPCFSNLAPWAQPFAYDRDSGKGRAVMLCDSFFRVGGLAADSSACPPLSIHFKRFVSIWGWVDASNLADYSLLSAIVDKEKPDVIVEQFTERYLRTPPPDHPEFQKARALSSHP
jgi:hypothetical protein